MYHNSSHQALGTIADTMEKDIRLKETSRINTNDLKKKMPVLHENEGDINEELFKRYGDAVK